MYINKSYKNKKVLAYSFIFTIVTNEMFYYLYQMETVTMINYQSRHRNITIIILAQSLLPITRFF